VTEEPGIDKTETELEVGEEKGVIGGRRGGKLT